MLDMVRTYVVSREDAELLFFFAQTAITFIALAALIYARAQVTESRRNSEIIAHQALANSLLNLEQRWNSEQLREARKLFVSISTKLREEVFKQHSNLKDEAAMAKVQERFTEEISRLMKEQLTGDYVMLLRIFGFFETVGLLVRKRYISIEDVDLLLRGPVLDFGLYFTPHLQQRQREKGVAPGLGENALFLVSEIKKRVP